MKLQQTITAFVALGNFLSQFTNTQAVKRDDITANDLFFDGFKQQLQLAEQHNGWFTKDNLCFAISSWSKLLTHDNITNWASQYTFNTTSKPKTVAIIMAGNIPLVGFHDFLSVLISGHSVLIKQSSNDTHILPYLVSYLAYIEPKLGSAITFTEGKLQHFDAVIATGSDNTARYFEYYFKDKPAIVRKNRNAVAVLTGNEAKTDLEHLSEDIFRYYGLGCRNVSKLFVPKGYNFDAFFEAVYKWHPIINRIKYANNYDYNKAIYLMSEFDILENGFLMIKEDKSYASPIATLFYEYYDNIDVLKARLEADTEQIQCVIANGVLGHNIAFGTSQNPQLHDYADGVDTLSFLLKI